MRVSITVVFFSAIFFVAVTMMLVAFLPTYFAGVKGIDDTIDSLREAIVRRSGGEVLSFFESFETYLSAWADDEKTGSGAHRNLNRIESFRKICQGALRFEAAWSVSYTSYDHPTEPARSCQLSDTLLFGKVFMGTSSNLTYSSVYPVHPVSVTPLFMLAPIITVPFFPAFFKSTSPFYNKNLTNYALTWTPASHGYRTLEFTLGFITTDEFNNEAIVSMVIEYTELQFALGNLTLPKRARVFAADARNKRMIATSWGEAPIYLYDPVNFRSVNNYADRMRLHTVSEMNDTLTKAALASVGGEDAFFQLATPYKNQFDGPDGNTYIDVIRLANNNSLDMRVVLMMPEIDFTEDVIKTRNTTIGAVVGTLAAMLILAVIFAILLARPLEQLGHRMYLTASLQDEEEDDARSALSEVADMQLAYETMKAELTRMKAYLPQSLLNAGDDEEDEGEVSEAGSSTNKTGRSRDASRMSASGDDRSSMRSTGSHSTKRSSAKGAAAVGPGLNMTRTMTAKRVAVAYFNLEGFHSTVKGNNMALERLQKTLLDVVQSNATANRGVVDVFQGDHVVVTFNAVNNCAIPARRAASCADGVAKELQKDAKMPRLTAGVAASTAIVGNMGTNGLLRFNVVGTCVGEAMAMERTAKAYLLAQTGESAADNLETHCIAMTSEVISDIQTEFFYESIDYVNLSSGIKVVSLLRQPKSASMDEWMYQLEEAEKGDPFAAGNKAFQSVSTNSVDGVREKLGSIRNGFARKRLEAIIDAPTVREGAGTVAVFPPSKK